MTPRYPRAAPPLSLRPPTRVEKVLAGLISFVFLFGLTGTAAAVVLSWALSVPWLMPVAVVLACAWSFTAVVLFRDGS